VRLFTGIAIGEDVMENLGRLLRELRPLAPFNWSPLENLHITTKFIGAWPEERLAELTQALADSRLPTAFPVNIAGVVHKPRMLFAGVRAGPELAALARQVEGAVQPLGVAPEQRAYMPHITLARTGDKPVGAVGEHLANMKNPDFGTFQVSELHLYSSRPRAGGSGSVYEILTSFSLGSRR
jgi:RNA 2',3'-cyclic 3'-phosphodiesterase